MRRFLVADLATELLSSFYAPRFIVITKASSLVEGSLPAPQIKMCGRGHARANRAFQTSGVYELHDNHVIRSRLSRNNETLVYPWIQLIFFKPKLVGIEFVSSIIYPLVCHYLHIAVRFKSVRAPLIL